MQSGVIEDGPNIAAFGERCLGCGYRRNAPLFGVLPWEVKSIPTCINKDGGILRNIFSYNCSHCSINRSIYNIGIPGFDHRQFVWKVLWRRIDECTVVVVNSPMLNSFDAVWNVCRKTPERCLVDSLKHGCWLHFRTLPTVNGIPQTKMPYMSQVNLSGHALQQRSLMR